MKQLIFILMSVLSIVGCTGTPVPAQPIADFNSDRYLGTWYEIARLDHSFERGLDNVTANYSFREDGQIKVLNRGYDMKKSDWKDAEGRAKFASDETTGHLRVSFFGPFFGDYIIFGLDESYRHAFISGGSDKFLWLLAREPDVSQSVKESFLASASSLGYNTDDLIWVAHDQPKE